MGVESHYIGPINVDIPRFLGGGKIFQWGDCLPHLVLSDDVIEKQIEDGLLKPELREKISYVLLRKHRHQTKKPIHRSLADIGKSVSSNTSECLGSNSYPVASLSLQLASPGAVNLRRRKGGNLSIWDTQLFTEAGKTQKALSLLVLRVADSWTEKQRCLLRWTKALCSRHQNCVMDIAFGQGASSLQANPVCSIAKPAYFWAFIKGDLFVFMLDYLLRFKWRSFGGAQDLRGFSCSPGRHKQQHPSPKCTWKRLSINNIPTPWASPGFKVAIIHAWVLDIWANICPDALKMDNNLDSLWIFPVDMENKGILHFLLMPHWDDGIASS